MDFAIAVGRGNDASQVFILKQVHLGKDVCTGRIQIILCQLCFPRFLQHSKVGNAGQSCAGGDLSNNQDKL